MPGLALQVSLDIGVSFYKLIRGKPPVQQHPILLAVRHPLTPAILTFTAIKTTAIGCCLATSAPVLLKWLIPVLTDVPVAATLMLDWKMVLSVTVRLLFAPMLSKLRKVNV